MEQFRDPPCRLCGKAVVSGCGTDRFDEFRELAFRVDPAAGDLKRIPSFLKGVVCLVSIGHQGAGEAFQEPLRMLSAPAA